MPLSAHTPSTPRPARLRALFAVAALMLAALAATPLTAQTRYPDRPIRFVVPYAPGGGTDILARAVAPRLSAALGQPVVVENRPGAGGNIGADLVAKSPSDGSVLLLGANTMPINASLQKLPFDLLKDFSAVAMMASAPMALVVHPSVQARTVQEFIAVARSAPGRMNYSNPGSGTPQHLAAALFSQMASVDITHVVYKGVGLRSMISWAGRRRRHSSPWRRSSSTSKADGYVRWLSRQPSAREPCPICQRLPRRGCRVMP